MVLKFLVAGFCVAWLFNYGMLDWQLLLQGAISPNVVLVGLLCNVVMISSGGLRWYLLLRGQGVVLPFRFVHRLSYITTFFNGIIPSGLGGDALRISYTLRYTQDRRGQAALTVVLDRFLGLYSMLLIATCFSFVLMDRISTSVPLKTLTYSTYLLVASGPVGILLLFWFSGRLSRIRAKLVTAGSWRRVVKIFDLIEEFIVLFRKEKFWVLLALLVSMAGQTLEILALVWIAMQLKMLIFPMQVLYLATPWAWVANILPVSPGGLGVGEAAFDHICQWFVGHSTPLAFGTVFLINRLFIILTSLPGLFFFLFRKQWLGDVPSDPPRAGG